MTMKYFSLLFGLVAGIIWAIPAAAKEAERRTVEVVVEHLTYEEFAQQFPGVPKPEGPKSFRLIPTGSALDIAGVNADLDNAAFESAASGGSLIAVEVQDEKCPEDTVLENRHKYHVYVLHMDESEDNRLDTDQSKSTATIRMVGRVDRYEPTADYCDSKQLARAGSGAGGIEVSFTTMNHMTPRNFVARTATGRIWGPGLSDNLGPLMIPGGGPSMPATSMALEEMAGLMPPGFDLSNLPVPANSPIDPKKPYFIATLMGSRTLPGPQPVPRLTVRFSSTSGTEGLGLTIHRPEVLGGGVVADAEELNTGATTFVNDDNDDRDADFDNALSDREVAGDDELVKVVLKVPPVIENNSYGTVKLDVTGLDTVKLWETANKETRFDPAQELRVPQDFTMEGSHARKELWVEGITAHTNPKQVRLTLTYSNMPGQKDEASLTVIGLEKLEWEGEGNSENGDDTLTEDPNYGYPATDSNGPTFTPIAGKGYRVFPGARMVNGQVETRPRNKVKVKATLSTAPPEPIKMFFDSFDVDDPTAFAPDSPVDNEAEVNDNRGEVPGGPNPKAGRFARERADGLVEVEFASQNAQFVFEVTMQPGDNFRVVGHGDSDFLLDLTNNDKELHVGNAPVLNENKLRIVNRYVWQENRTNPAQAEVRNAEKCVTPTLAVWRYFYAEMDRMLPVKENRLVGRITGARPNDPAQGWTTITLDRNLRSHYDVSSGLENCFEHGEMELTNYGKFKVISNTSYWWASDEVVIVGFVPAVADNAAYTLVDDDKTVHGFDEGTPIPELDTRTVDERYRFAYIVPDFTTLSATNKTKEVPFVANTKGDTFKDLEPNYVFDHREHEANRNFWTIYLLAAFQGTHIEDGDPDSEQKITGIIDKFGGLGAHIFVEGMNDFSGPINNNVRIATTNLGQGEQDTIAHEIGHLFGGTHGDGALMNQQGRFFSDKSLAKFRSATNP